MKKTQETIINYRPRNGSYWAYRVNTLEPSEEGGELIARGDTLKECRERVFEWIDEKREAELLNKLQKELKRRQRSQN